MMDPSFRDALLNRMEKRPWTAQLKVLDNLVNADRRYVRRLTIGTIAVWAVWVSLMAIGLGLPMVLQATAPRVASPPQAAATSTETSVPRPVPAIGHSNPGGPMRVVMMIVAVLVMIMLFTLPLAGVVLLVMMIAARRTATMSQVQASLLAINAQLKLILSQKTPSTGA